MKQLKTYIEPLKLAVAICGSQKEMAGKLGISQNHLSNCVNGRANIPAKYCRKIEAITNGDITAEELRPDIFYKADEPEMV